MLINVSPGADWYYDDNDAFIFSLVSNEWKTPIMMPVKNNSSGVLAKTKAGPAFGTFKGSAKSDLFKLDFKISSEPLIEMSQSMYSGAFDYPKPLHGNKRFLAGAEKFLVRKMEVFKVESV